MTQLDRPLHEFEFSGRTPDPRGDFAPPVIDYRSNHGELKCFCECCKTHSAEENQRVCNRCLNRVWCD